MIYVIIAVVALAMMIGMVLMSYVVGGKETPKGAAIGHGIFAVTAIILLVIYLFNEGPGPWESFILFILAAFGGIIMIFRDIKGKKIPHALAAGHSMLAMAGMLFLLVYTICEWTWLGDLF